MEPSKIGALDVLKFALKTLGRGLHFAFLGAFMLAAFGLLQGAISGALIMVFVAILGGARGGARGGGLLSAFVAVFIGGGYGALCGLCVGLITGAIVFFLVAFVVISARSSSDALDAALRRSWLATAWGVGIGGIVGATNGALFPFFPALRRLLGNSLNSFFFCIYGVVLGFVIGAFIGAIRGALDEVKRQRAEENSA